SSRPPAPAGTELVEISNAGAADVGLVGFVCSPPPRAGASSVGVSKARGASPHESCIGTMCQEWPPSAVASNRTPKGWSASRMKPCWAAINDTQGGEYWTGIVLLTTVQVRPPSALS